MREIKTEIVISAPVPKVWNVLTNFNGWQEWNPVVNKTSGTSTLGSELSIVMKGEDGNDGAKYAPVVTISEEPKSFCWRAKMMAEFLFTNEKVFELEKTASGTRLIHKELFKGLLVPIFWGKINGGVPDILNSMNSALKTQVEQSVQ